MYQTRATTSSSVVRKFISSGSYLPARIRSSASVPILESAYDAFDALEKS